MEGRGEGEVERQGGGREVGEVGRWVGYKYKAQQTEYRNGGEAILYQVRRETTG